MHTKKKKDICKRTFKEDNRAKAAFFMPSNNYLVEKKKIIPALGKDRAKMLRNPFILPSQLVIMT